MDTQRTVRAFVEASAALVKERDTTGTLATLITDSLDVLSIEAAGILVADGGEVLELLASSSREIAELEVYEAQIEQGPCVDAWRANTAVSVTGPEEIVARWPAAGAVIVGQGYGHVHATPMTYQGNSVGAFNTFRREPSDFSPDERAISQAFADIATMTIVHSGSLGFSGIVERLHEALSARVVIEQAKGVLAQQFHLTVGEAYDVLASRAATESYTVTALARSIVDSTHNS